MNLMPEQKGKMFQKVIKIDNLINKDIQDSREFERQIKALSTDKALTNEIIEKYFNGELVRRLDNDSKRSAFHIVNKVIGEMSLGEFYKNSKRMIKFNNQTALNMIARNKNTEFGKKHGFEDILKSKNPLDEFKKRVPVTDYWYFEDSINRMANGEKNILTAEDPTFFALSSGTTGKNKLIPVNKTSHSEALKGIMVLNAMISKIIPGADSVARGINLMRVDDSQHKTPSGIPMGDASSGGLRKVAWMLPLLYTTPTEALTISDKPTANYVHAVFGLRDRNLKHITATFAPYVIQLMKDTEKRWPDIVETVRSGKLPSDLKLTEDEKTNLQKLLIPNPKRAEELKKEFSKGFENIIPRVWPKFKYIGAVTSGSFDVYIPDLKKYAGDTVIYNGTYGASEGWMGVSNSIKKPNEFVLYPGANYYEFIPVENLDDKNPKTVDIKDLKQGKEYEMVLTTHSGFYRYRMGDIVEKKGSVDENPVIEFKYRRGTLLNLFGEKLTERQTTDALKSFSNELRKKNIEFIDFTTTSNSNIVPPGYKFYIELKSDKNIFDNEFREKTTNLLENELRKTSFDYGDMRDKRMLSRMEICYVKPGAFDRLVETMRNANDVKLSNQIKVPRLLKNPKIIEQMEREKIV